MPHFLGIDSSTQSTSGLVIDTQARQVVCEFSINYGRDLPQYQAPEGFLPHDDPLVKHADPLMWVEALDRFFQRGREQGCDWSRLEGISCSGQQHGSVYLNAAFATGGWDPQRPLVEQVRPLLARRTAPIWMDSSTAQQCREIADAAGGEARVLQITGSRPTERFTGPQIRKFYQHEPEAYRATARIHLVSSFLAYLLCGSDVPIDYGDGAGMNLMDLSSGTWSRQMLQATAPDLASRLPPLVPSATVVGTVSPYFVQRYGVNPRAQVVASTGDNPSSLIGMGASQPGTVVVSLGTSDTYFAAMDRVRTDPRGYGHVFGNPAGGFMSLICFLNGSLTRGEIARRFGMTWDAFSEALRRTPPGNEGNLMLPYVFPEITPRILKPEVKLFGTPQFTTWSDPAAAVRAVVEAQALSMRLHSDWIRSGGAGCDRLLVTGGGSQNEAIVQVLADVFQAPAYRLAVSKSAALGAALRAAQACGAADWGQLYADFAAPEPQAIAPQPQTAAIYDRMLPRFAQRLAECYG
jgi:xylulokinase